METFISLFLHLDKHLHEIILTFGNWTYAILFLVIFCETGLVFTPFLPGDSLLFIAGAFAALGSLNPFLLFFLLLVAAIVGDSLNYMIGYKVGVKLFEKNWPFLKKEYLVRTQEFYEKHGHMTIILARYIPIIRTFAPFVAGVGSMTYRRFMIYNVVGAVTWVGLFLTLGYFFGNIPQVKNNLSLVIIGIIFLSILPPIIQFLKFKYSCMSCKKSSISS